jgi:tRNA A58 N-methylase Trm61
VYLHIKRRRWTNKTTGEIIKRDWLLVAKGTRMTQELRSFLKEIIDNTAVNCHTIGSFFS